MVASAVAVAGVGRCDGLGRGDLRCQPSLSVCRKDGLLHPPAAGNADGESVQGGDRFVGQAVGPQQAAGAFCWRCQSPGGLLSVLSMAGRVSGGILSVLTYSRPLCQAYARDAWVGRQRPSQRKGVRETLGGLSARRYDAVGIGSRGRVSREPQVPTALDDLLEPK